MLRSSDTIVALSTPYGVSGIGVVRVSGPEAIHVVEKIFIGKTTLSRVASHTVHHGSIVKPESKEPVDDVLVAVFREPNSYTGENLIEISCHGNPYLIDSIIKIITSQGGRMAQPGEFTQRALLNGRLDLIQAEAVVDLIAAQGERTRQQAYQQLEGRLSQKIRGLSDQLVELLTQVEANLDFPEDEEWLTIAEIRKGVDGVCEKMDRLLQGAEVNIMMRSGPRIVIVGRPNVGKSSLFNQLLGYERAIVTEMPGTTRDFIEENLIVGDLWFRLVDTAGLGLARDKAESIGVEKTRQIIDDAQLLLILFDLSEEITDYDSAILKSTQDKKRLLVFNKNDLPPRLEKSRILKTISQPVDWANVSAMTGSGIDSLKGKLLNCFERPEAIEGSLITRRRQLEALQKAREALAQIKEQDFFETIALELRLALDALAALVGKITSEDILNKIFSEFCVGK